MTTPAEDEVWGEWYRNGYRVRVQYCDMTITGLVSRSLGPSPVYLLLRRRDSICSPWVLNSSDRVLAFKRPGDRTYTLVT